MSKTKAIGADNAIEEFRKLGGPFSLIKAGMGINNIRTYSASIRLFNALYPNAIHTLPIGEPRVVVKLNMKKKEDDE
jgi:hypothetical protein